MGTNASTGERNNSAKPHINVTPLIDVLLVMLIIFMVVSPLQPSRFLTKTASKPEDDQTLQPNDKTVVVTINADRTLMLNQQRGMGSVNDLSKLTTTLYELFQERLQNKTYRDDLRDRVDLPDHARVERTVFIKAPRFIPYADVVRVLDAIKGAGATPVGLQIDDLD
jgi:biopolymer transport protein ExbD